MREVIAEIEAGGEASPEAYGDHGCRLTLRSGKPMFLRHERYTTKGFDSVYLFARAPEVGAQVYLHIFPAVGDPTEWEAEVGRFRDLRSDFRLPEGQVFSPAFLAPDASGLESHEAFRVRDGRRRRVVHAFLGSHRRVLLVYASDTEDFLSSPFFQAVASGLSLNDLPLESPFRR